MIFSNFFMKYRSNNNVKTEGFFSDWNDLDDDADQKKNRKHDVKKRKFHINEKIL